MEYWGGYSWVRLLFWDVIFGMNTKNGNIWVHDFCTWMSASRNYHTKTAMRHCSFNKTKVMPTHPAHQQPQQHQDQRWWEIGQVISEIPGRGLSLSHEFMLCSWIMADNFTECPYFIICNSWNSIKLLIDEWHGPYRASWPLSYHVNLRTLIG